MGNSKRSLGVFVVSMPDAQLRRAHMQQELGKQGIPFVFFDALDGGQAQLALLQYGLRFEADALTPGELGCAMSHITLWRRLLESGAETMVVLEDDIFLGRGAQRFLLDTSWMPEPASRQVLKLEKYQELVLLGRAHSLVDGRRLHILRSDHWGSAGYVIGRGAAKSMLEHLAHRPLSQAIDHFIFDVFRQLEPNSVWQINPAICIQEVVHEQKNGLGSGLAMAREQRHTALQLGKPRLRWRRHLRLFRWRYWQAKIEKWRFREKIHFV